MPDTATSQHESWLHRHTHILRHRPHFSTAAALFLVLLATTFGAGVDFARGMLYAFDVSAAIFLTSIVWMFGRSPVSVIRARVAQQDAGRWGVLISGVAVSAVAIVSLGIELHAADTGGGIPMIVLGAASLVLSWLFLNTMFGLHYAHEYYSGSEKHKALAFPGDCEPDYWDFMYFAFVLGMTFQVSDVQIQRRSVRRVALAHGIVAFFFDVFILALSVNVVAGKI
ncbi:MAG TPA: DUF1345 domain-containing protein [Rhodanobacteraceae bacterium]|nr:DUF1345 domain-containing protein [Rhodanobacteraceae bacterium]